MNGIKQVMACSAAMAALAAAMPAMAQAAPAEEQTGSEIVVTAQKRNERLIDVPVAISAVSSETLTTQNMNRLSDYYNRIPGLQYAGQRVSAISLRGVTTGGATGPTVALLVDDVQFGGTTATGQPPLPDFDASAIDRVEVLRGPQGTLYGAASLGGLIKYVLKEPSTEKFSGRAELGATAASHGDTGYSLRGSVNIPVSDWLAVSGSGFKREDAPYLDNARTAKKDTNTRDVWGFRAAALVKPTDNLRLVFSALHQKTDAINSDLAVVAGGVRICAACITDNTAPTTFDPVDGDLTINSLDSVNIAKFKLYTARADLDLGNAAITSISAWSRADNVITSDVSAVFGGLLRARYGLATRPNVQIANADKTHKFSQELRIAGDTPAFSWLVGGFYTIEHASTDQTLIMSGSGTGLPYIGTGPGSYREYAGFADLTWHVTEKFDVQFGGRYAHNKQKNFSNLILAPEVEGVFGVTGTTPGRSSDSAFTWLVSPTYHFTPDIMAYLRVASGYRPGGPNIGSPPGAPSSFGSDRVINYELGFKGKVVPDFLTIDASLFQIDWKDIQLQGADPITSLTFVDNGGKARSRGLEFSANITPWAGMSIDANIAFTDATITQDILDLQGGTGFRGVPGDRLPFSAKVAGSISAQQNFPINPDLDGNIGFSLIYLGDRPGQFQTNSDDATRPRILMPGYTVFDLRAGLVYDRDWTLGLYVRNLFDKRGVSIADNRNGTTTPTALFIQPRIFGVSFARTF
ncbi:MAG: TonB-dependent receptor [Novosphingobium sp.]|nr:TonB-dependent receptor [Novosphingobium sp.]